jgi:hypothetical protein
MRKSVVFQSIKFNRQRRPRHLTVGPPEPGGFGPGRKREGIDRG